MADVEKDIGQAILDRDTWIAYIFIGVVGVLGNAFVVLVLLRFTAMKRRLTHVYIINQSVIDSIASLMLVLTTVFQYDGITPLPPGLAGRFYCAFWFQKVSTIYLQESNDDTTRLQLLVRVYFGSQDIGPNERSRTA